MADRDSLIDAEYEPEDDQFPPRHVDEWERDTRQGEIEREGGDDD